MDKLVLKNKRRGKAVQKKVVESLGGKNVGTLGSEDGEHPIWSIEVKSCKKFSGKKYMNQCIKNCKEGKTPLLIVHVTGEHHNNDLVIMRRSDWDDWFGRLNNENKSM
jgi:hypothetical protein